MLNFNFGGIKGSSPSGLTTSYRTREGSGDTEVSVIDGFRAYASAAEGASDYVGLLTRRYPEAVEAARTGDSAGFVRALKARGYFTGNANAYVKSVTQLSNRALVSGYDAIGARETGALALGAETAHAPPTPQVSHLLARASHSLASVTELLSGPEASVASSWGEEMDDAVRRTQLLMAALDLELDASHRRHDEMRR